MKFRQSQADKLVSMRQDLDKGKITEAQLTAEVRKSTGHEINEAMDEFGGTEKWNA